MQGYIQIYTGEGKGKTTASLGLALRACGAGLKIYIGQFIKSGDYSEIKALAHLAPQVMVEQFGLGRFLKNDPQDKDIQMARKGLKAIEKAMCGCAYDLVIADEILVAATCGLITENQILALMEGRPEQVELVLTGRGATPAILERADLITEMKAVKHYFQQGVGAREGIEK